jgi:hypothetical protein
MDLDLRKIASTALIIFGAWIAVSAMGFRHEKLQAMNAFLVGITIVALAIVGRRRAGGAYWATFGACAVVAAWLFVSSLVLPGRTPGIQAHHLLLATLAFGFAGTALAAPPRAAA